MRIRNLSQIFAMCVTLVTAGVACATSIEATNLSELASSSAIVVQGRVVGSRTERTSAGIVTITTISVRQTWGQPTSIPEIEILTPGGELDGLRQVVAGAEWYSLGETVLVFLDAPRDGLFHTNALAFSKFSLDVQNQVWRRDTVGLNLVTDVPNEGTNSLEAPSSALSAPDYEVEATIGTNQDWHRSAFEVREMSAVLDQTLGEPAMQVSQ